MKKKGFTLIELLAVIIILAIIVLVATPIVLNIIDDYREKAAKDSAYGVLHSANYYYAEEYMKNNGSFSEYECSFNNGVGCDLLSISGDKPTSGSLSINKDGRVNGKVEFNDYKFYICNSKVLEEESSECSFIEYEKIYAINEEGIITGFKTNDVASILDYIIPVVNATNLTTEASEYIEDGKITIPEYINNIEVTGIAANAFSSYEITEVTLLSSKLITIGENAFPSTLTKLRVNSCLVDSYNLDVTIEGFGSGCNTTPQVTYKCKRATTLHTETCNPSEASYYCRAAGYASGATVTYGQLGTKGTLASGDAFDCDVDGDGDFGECTTTDDGKTVCAERFYYVSELYDTLTKEFDSKYAVLIYSNSTTNGIIDNNSTNLITYANNNYVGPLNAIVNLPTVTQWSNVSLSNPTRAIISHTGTNTASSRSLPTEFSYEGYAARLLTAQEVNVACGITIGSRKIGEIQACNYLLENTNFTSTGKTQGYWLETPHATTSPRVWVTNCKFRYIEYPYANTSTAYGVRPVIEVLKTDIEY